MITINNNCNNYSVLHLRNAFVFANYFCVLPIMQMLKTVEAGLAQFPHSV